MRTRLALAAALLACGGGKPFVTRGEPVVTFEGKVEKGPAVIGATDLESLARRGFEALPPDGERARFEGLALAPLLGDRLELARDADTVVFHGQGGRAAAVPLVSIRQLKPVLADKADGAAIAAWRSEAAPLQLAWPNLGAPGIDTDPRVRWWWVGGVRRVEVVSWIATYGRVLRVPPGASDGARLGAGVLATSCLACHRLRGLGGTRGPELAAGLVAGDTQALANRLRPHLQQASGLASAPELTPVEVGQVVAFLRTVELAARSEDEVKEPEKVEPPPALPHAGVHR
jgi:mono/diheme cytochrome c family protein